MANVESQISLKQCTISGDETKPRKIVNLFPKFSELTYVICYCEENVWNLCADVKKNHPTELEHCYVVFVSNAARTVPLWRQKSGKDEDKLVIWDYHVIFIYNPYLDSCLVYDFDSVLPFPTYIHKYIVETFRTDQILKPECFRYFRVVPADEFLANFASDRRHMKRKDGTWIKTPPAYSPIKTKDCVNNLDEYIQMDASKGPGSVFSLTQFVQRFYKPRNTIASTTTTTTTT